MCGRYVLFMDIMDDRMNLIIEMCNKYINENCEIVIRDNGEICPSDAAPALAIVKNKVSAMAMRWGIYSAQSSKLIINARSETAGERIMFKRMLENQRCALPAAGYFEWRDTDNLRYLISHVNGEAFYLAGLYAYGDDGTARFVVLTKDAYGEHMKIHGRMPCLLYTKEEARQWISGMLSPEQLSRRTGENLIIKALEAEQLRMDFDD